MTPTNPLDSIVFINLPEDFKLSKEAMHIDTTIPLPVQLPVQAGVFDTSKLDISKALSEGGIKAAGVIIDGLASKFFSASELKILKAYAAEAGLSFWFSYNADEEDVNKIFGDEVAAEINTVVHLEQKPDIIQMKVLKAHNTEVQNINLKLDSKTLLLSEK